jgi:hypothetical protein
VAPDAPRIIRLQAIVVMALEEVIGGPLFGLKKLDWDRREI